MEITLINQNDENYAKKKLENYYENSLIPAEKKAYLTELNNNLGPYMGIESENNETHYLMDAASQIATLGLGFSPSVFMGVAHSLASWTNNPENPQFLKIKNALHSFLMRKTGWTHLDMTLCNSGAESNEIALGYAYKRRINPKANKVLAFEGSFHGRMLISLFSTWNKSKREPFQRTGYETIFNSYPELPDANVNLKYPSQWRETWDDAPSKHFNCPNDWQKDEMLKKECDSLCEVREQLLKGEVFAIIIEPMQCEGGDRYASDRFHTALLIMAKSFGVPVIHDEVQTGFHLGREFFWHRHFCLTDKKGNQLNPDYLVCAKKAQVGMVLSPHDLKRDKLERREQFQVPSAIRGYYHAMALDQQRERIIKIEEYAEQKLLKLLKTFSKHLSRPRVKGLSFAFDVDETDNVQEYIAKRFDHGLLYYPAGSHTLRFRLNTSYDFKDIDFLFERLHAISEDIFDKKTPNFNGKAITKARNVSAVTKWQNKILSQRLNAFHGKTEDETKLLNDWSNFLETIVPPEEKNSLKVISITKENFDSFAADIEDIQKTTYEPTRQTPLDRFKVCAHSEYGINLAIHDGEKIVAMAFSSSLKDHPLERGIRQDLDFNNPKALYMIDTTVRKGLQTHGLGRLLKYTLTSLALNRGYHSIKGRNRDRLAAGMLNINLSLGFVEEFFLKEDYPDFEKYRDVVYYQCPLFWDEETSRLGNATNSPLSIEDISEGFIEQQLPYLTNKVCLSNFVSENFLAHVKAILSTAPKELRHGYTASGQSECVDKVFKSFIYNDKESFDNNKPMVTMKGHYFGNGSFLSRSLSTENREEAYFPVAKLEEDNFMEELKKLVTTEGVSSVWLEPVSQLTFKPMKESLLKEIVKFCREKKIPLVYNETASSKYQFSDDHYFASNKEELRPNAMMAFLGGQAGIVAIEESYFVEKPLMMISTWDGDEHAFATYHTAMQTLIDQRKEYVATKEFFHQKIEKELSSYSNLCLSLHKGKGIISGALSQKWKDLFQETPEGYKIDASFTEMKKFNE